MVRTRIAPSPTGEDVHVGTVATALMNYAWAKKNGGQFIIRIEDTDRSRMVAGGEERMLQTLNQLGLTADESPLVGGPYQPYRQSQRLAIYKQHAEALIKKKQAYYCICSPQRLDEMRKKQQAEKRIPKYDRHCFNHQAEVSNQIKNGAQYVIRLLMPDREIVFDDVVRGHIVVHGSNLDDQVLLKSDGFPTYHLAVVVDDHLMQISHVIRGEEWLSSTPKHVVLYEAFGWELPVFAHTSLLRNPDKSKLSKRKNPVWASQYLAQGIFSEALINYLALMGWSHPKGKEIFDLQEYVRVFDPKDIQTSAPVFDPVKLEWLNGMYIRELSIKDLGLRITQYIGDNYPKDIVSQTIPLVRERIKKLEDYLPLCGFFYKPPDKYALDLSPKKAVMEKIYHALSKVTDWKADQIGAVMLQTAQDLQMRNGEFFMLLRVAITGSKISPPLNESMEILGKPTCLKRIKILL
ncbi:glutamate--tRNA ligase [Patescibacteria group bacterium]|nr:glutamate--tRNA ligase [Patescibacteria group bacterium]MCL5091291.1 glutamate--tRNA ligase [Patescibacteria group bacterium]